MIDEAAELVDGLPDAAALSMRVPEELGCAPDPN